MSQIVDDLRQVAIEIKTETQVGGNTAARVGGAFERVADALEGTQQIEDMDAAVAAVQQAAQENEQTIQDLVNNLAVTQTTGQSTSDVMSQKAVTDEIDNIGYNYEEMDLSTISVGNYRLTSTKKWTGNSAEKHYWIPCAAGDIFRVTGGTVDFNYAFMKIHNNIANANANVCSIYTGTLPVCAAGQTITITAPSDATGLALNKVVNGSDVNISKIERVTTIKDDIAEIRDNIENIDSQLQVLGDVRAAVSAGTGRVNASTGILSTETTFGHTNYLPINGAPQILVYAPTMESAAYGLAFYRRIDYSTYISGLLFDDVGTFGSSVWKLIDVPEGANYFRYSTWLNTDSQYKLVVPIEYLLDIFNDAAATCLATQIFRQAKVVSNESFLFAFGISQMAIVGHKAYIRYASNEHKVDGDTLNNSNVAAMSIVDLFDLSSEVVFPTIGTTKYNDGTTANPDAIQYSTYCPTPNGDIATFALMRFNNNNPYYCWAIEAADVTVNNWKTCKLNYQANGTTHNVDFTINAYRQMLVDMGYTQTYVASTLDMVDNVNIHYDKTEGIYYAVLCGTQSSSQILPIVLMESADLSTWSPMAYLGINTDADEIGAIYKEGIVYVAYRTYTHGMNYVVYDVEHNTLISSGKFPTSNDMLSKPDVFTFDNNVYMAININPSVYGDLTAYQAYYVNARQEIAIYKVVDGVPKFFRRVNNPTGLQYFSFMETPPMYANEQSVYPMYAQGAIYCAFSEDRRHLYRRQIAQVSFADVTALFADNGRIG